MGLLQYDWENETRLIHFCKHEVIKDMVPDKVDVVSGTWYVKEPSEMGRAISISEIKWTKPPPGVPRLVFIYLNHQLRPGGAWAGWKMADFHYKDEDSCFDILITKLTNKC